MALNENQRRQLLAFQKSEITEHHVYAHLARRVRRSEDRRILEQIAADELRHYQLWRRYTGRDVRPNRSMVWTICAFSRLLGLTFAVKWMERGEQEAQQAYHQLRDVVAEAETIAREEEHHEAALLEMLDEERLRYAGSVVLGLSDALVELTGALAGLTLALQNTRLVALTGSITGVAAALSMAASEYLSTKTEGQGKNPLRASLYTGGAYLVTVLSLILPYLLLGNYWLCLACALAAALLIIALFNYTLAVAKDEPFKERFVEMAGLCLGVAAISFAIGWALRHFLGVDV